MAPTVTEFCVRTVSHAPRNPGQHRRLRGHVDAYRCCVKSLIRSALVGFDVRQHARAESISKRAPSTTRTSLRSLESAVYRLVVELANPNCVANCVRPPNVPRSLTALGGSRRAADERFQYKPFGKRDFRASDSTWVRQQMPDRERGASPASSRMELFTRLLEAGKPDRVVESITGIFRGGCWSTIRTSDSVRRKPRLIGLTRPARAGSIKATK